MENNATNLQTITSSQSNNTPKNVNTKYIKIIGSIFALFLLINGVALGTYLTQKPKEVVQSKASDCAVIWTGVTGCFEVVNCAVEGFIVQRENSVGAGTTDTECIGTSEFPQPEPRPLDPGTYCPRDFGNACEQCVQVDNPSAGGGSAQYTYDCATLPPEPRPWATTTPQPTVQPTVPPLPTPTAPPEESIVCACTTLAAYNTNWNKLSIEDLSTLTPGTIIYFSVTGEANDDGITMARFTINNVQREPVTTQRPGYTNQYYETYTIPELAEDEEFSISVKGELYHEGLGIWF